MEQARVAAASAGGGALPPHLPANPTNQQYTTFMNAMAATPVGQQIMGMAMGKRTEDMNTNQ